MPQTPAQKAAQARYRAANRDKERHQVARRAAKHFILKKASLDELQEFKRFIKERENELSD